jgi:hypothetical protein
MSQGPLLVMIFVQFGVIEETTKKAGQILCCLIGATRLDFSGM